MTLPSTTRRMRPPHESFVLKKNMSSLLFKTRFVCCSADFGEKDRRTHADDCLEGLTCNQEQHSHAYKALGNAMRSFFCSWLRCAPSNKCSGRSNLRHFTAKRRTPSTFLRAVCAKRMMRSMAFAGLCTCVAYFSTKLADLFDQWGEAAHPLCREGTDVSAFTTHASAEGH
jgi:hypothetical protein